MAKLDMKRLSPLDWVLIGAAALALISLFLPWYSASVGPYSASVSGFSTGYGWLAGLLVVAAGVYLLLQRAEVNLTRMPFGPGFAVLALSAIGTLLVIIRWLTLPRGHFGVSGVTVLHYGPSVGIYLTLICGIVEVVCAAMIFRNSGEKLPWASNQPQPPS